MLSVYPNSSSVLKFISKIIPTIWRKVRKTVIRLTDNVWQSPR